MQAETLRRPPYPFCPWCGERLPQEDPYRQACAACRFVLYHNSSPCMAAIVMDDRRRVLLGRRAIEPHKGDWNLIGGFLQYGEDPFTGLRREVQEELGVSCDPEMFVDAVADAYGPGGPALLNLYFTVRPRSRDFRPDDDVDELRWFPLDAPPENLAFESDRRALRTLASRVAATTAPPHCTGTERGTGDARP